MKKLLVLALSALLVLGLASVSMAAATLSGEISARYVGNTVSGKTDYNGAIFGKMVLNGKIGDDITGTLVYHNDQALSIDCDEASILFTEDWGSFKAGYYGWNTNLKDIINTNRGDVKKNTTLSVDFAITDGLNLGLAYGLPDQTTETAPYGAKLAFAGDNFGIDVMYTNTGKSLTDNTTQPDTVFANQTGIGVQGKIKLDAFTPFFQYENYNTGLTTGNAVDTVIGFLFDPAAPFYARAEVDLTALNGVTEWGARFGYYLTEDKNAKIQAQYAVVAATKKVSGTPETTMLEANGTAKSDWYLRLICAF